MPVEKARVRTPSPASQLGAQASGDVHFTRLAPQPRGQATVEGCGLRACANTQLPNTLQGFPKIRVPRACRVRTAKCNSPPGALAPKAGAPTQRGRERSAHITEEGLPAQGTVLADASSQPVPLCPAAVEWALRREQLARRCCSGWRVKEGGAHQLRARKAGIHTGEVRTEGATTMRVRRQPSVTPARRVSSSLSETGACAGAATVVRREPAQCTAVVGRAHHWKHPAGRHGTGRDLRCGSVSAS